MGSIKTGNDIICLYYILGILMTRARDLANAAVSTGAGAIAWSIITSDYSALPSQGLFADTTNNRITVTLPTSPSTGDTILISDKAGKFRANPLTINTGSEKLNGRSGPLVLNIADASVVLIYTDNIIGWRLA